MSDPSRGPVREFGSSITINGVWGKVISGIILAAILAGASGLVTAMRIGWNQQGILLRVERIENSFDRIEGRLDKIERDVSILVDRAKRENPPRAQPPSRHPSPSTGKAPRGRIWIASRQSGS